PYNQILIFYGSSDTSIMALDTLKFVWSVATISNIGGSPSSLFSFASTLIGAYILIAFGRINNYKWVTVYDPTKQLQSIQPIPTTPTSSTSSLSTDSSSNIAAIIGGTFGGLAGLIVLITIAVLIVKRYGHPSHSNLELEESSKFNENSNFDYNLNEVDNQFNSSEPLFGGPFYELYLNYILHLMKTTWRGELRSWTFCQDFAPQFSGDPNQFHFTSENVSSDHFTVLSMDQNLSQSVACPEFWAIPINELNCRVVYNGYEPGADLSIGAYYDRIVNGKVMEKLLAIAGIRIAAV
ncbi:17412_t:CDS:2, partial [Racocetra fulgida]